MGRTCLYGIIEGSATAAPGVPGADGVSPVHVVTHDGLGCVVSGYRGGDLGALPRDRLLRSLLAHQQVVEHAMEGRSVLPVKFGTLLNNRQEVLDLLSQRHEKLRDALASIRDRVEFEVAATWDTGRVLAEIGREEEVVRAREAIARKGQATVEDRVQLGQVVKTLMDRRRDGYRERMVGLLSPLSIDVAPNALVSDGMVMNVAFLVERVREKEFYESVEQLDRLYQDQIAFRVIGPLPPYSFSTVEVTRLTPEEVKEARQALHLKDVPSEADIRKAYRHLAAQQQRHLQAGDEPARDRVARLRQAVRVLLGCSQAQSHTANGHGSGNVFVVTIRRSGSDEVGPSRFGVAAPVGWGEA